MRLADQKAGNFVHAAEWRGENGLTARLAGRRLNEGLPATLKPFKDSRDCGLLMEWSLPPSLAEEEATREDKAAEEVAGQVAEGVVPLSTISGCTPLANRRHISGKLMCSSRCIWARWKAGDLIGAANQPPDWEETAKAEWRPHHALLELTIGSVLRAI